MEIPMNLKNDEENCRGPFAIYVIFPEIDDIIPRLRDAVTRESKGARPEQRVSQVAGKVVGHVPANLCRVFREIEGFLFQPIAVLYTGGIKQICKPTCIAEIPKKSPGWSGPSRGRCRFALYIRSSRKNRFLQASFSFN